ncbi:MAG: hypothetical protein ACK44W_14945, partial [Planctomycetota bacterium]
RATKCAVRTTSREADAWCGGRWWGAVLLAALGCRKRELVRVDTSEAADIPREVAVDKLRELLPTADQVVCTLPSERLRQSEIKEWTISG